MRSVQRAEAEVLLATLQERIARREVWERDAFELRDLWIADEGEELIVKIVYRQGETSFWWGYAIRQVVPSYQNRPVSPEEAAHDIYDFVLVEPNSPPTSPPDSQGVRWQFAPDE